MYYCLCLVFDGVVVIMHHANMDEYDKNNNDVDNDAAIYGWYVSENWNEDDDDDEVINY